MVATRAWDAEHAVSRSDMGVSRMPTIRVADVFVSLKLSFAELAMISHKHFQSDIFAIPICGGVISHWDGR